MTENEAIKMLKSKMDGHTDTSYEWAETVRMAIKALEAQPCEDAISRADAKKYLSALDANGDRVIYESDLDLLPPVTPKAEQEAVLDKIRAEIEETYMNITYQENKDRKATWGLRRALEIIDKYKAESEG